MAYTTFSREKVDHVRQPMFFGSFVNVARYDRVKYDFLNELSDRQLSFFWRPEEIDISQDRKDFNQSLAPHEQHIFTSNLKYQTLLDSVQGRSLMLSLLKVVSLPELENWIENWSFSETIHSRSYSHIIRNLYANPDVVFDDVIENKYVAERAASVTSRYDRFIERAERYVSHKNIFDKCGLQQEVVTASIASLDVNEPWARNESDRFSMYDLMKDLYLLLVDIYALETLRFYVSFACSFAFAERKLMEGNAKIIRFIARDENLHREGTAKMLHKLIDGSEGPTWEHIARQCEKETVEIFESVATQEKEWASYLFKDGSMLGLNKQIIDSYVDYTMGMGLMAIGIRTDHYTTNNPLPWMENYIESDSLQVAPQEAEVATYLTSDLNNDASSDAFSGMDL